MCRGQRLSWCPCLPQKLLHVYMITITIIIIGRVSTEHVYAVDALPIVPSPHFHPLYEYAVPQFAWGSQRTTCVNLVLPSTTWVPGIELGPSPLAADAFSHESSLCPVLSWLLIPNSLPFLRMLSMHLQMTLMLFILFLQKMTPQTEPVLSSLPKYLHLRHFLEKSN